MEYVPPIGGAADDPYIDAVPASGIDGSVVPAGAIEDVMREVVHVIETSGQTPASEDLTQLYTAIAAMIGASLAPNASTTRRGIVELATNTETTTGTDAERAVTPAGLAGAITSHNNDTSAHPDIQDLIANASDDLLRKRVMLLALYRAMDNAAAQYNLIQDFYDDFQDLTGVVAESFEGTHDAAATCITANGGTNTVNIATVAQAIGNLLDSFQAFDGDLSLAAGTTSRPEGAYVGQHFATAVELGKMEMYQDVGTPGHSVDSCTIRYSDDGTNWTIAQTYTGLIAFQWDELIIPSGCGSHAYWAVFAPAGTGGWQVAGLTMYDLLPDNLSVTSLTASSVATPDTAYVLGLLEIPLLATLNTDVICSVTRDGGTTWEAITLIKEGYDIEGVDIYYAEHDFTGATDTNMAVRLQTFNDYDVTLHAWAMQW